MDSPVHFVEFTLDDSRFALPLEVVERVLRAVEVTPLPHAPPTIMGMINLHGQVVPVVNLRRRYGLPGREVDPSDQIILVRTLKRLFGLLVDSARVVDCEADAWTSAEEVLPHFQEMRGVVKGETGLVLVYDLEQLIALHEERALTGAIKG